MDYLQIETSTTPDAAIIWLHGLGADGNDFGPMVPELHLPDELKVRFIFPHAPERPVTINQGYVMRAWYDITAPNVTGEQDVTGMDESCQSIQTLIDEQIELGIAASRIILAGFSQGGAIALKLGLTSETQVRGIMALSTYLPEATSIRNEKKEHLSIFVAHGAYDDVIPCHHGKSSCQKLMDIGFKPEWHEYPMAHSVCPEEISDISRWIISLL